jgi:aryl-alcohol dehydrogenase-like predicted oxidoreductase
MKYRPYIQGDTPISEIGFGAWQLGIDSGWKAVSEKEALNLVHKAIDLGVNFFDTAPVYGNGTSELRLGKAFKGKDRSKLVINSKFGRSDTGAVDFSAALIRPTLEGSLRRLGLDYIDSVIIHSPPLGLLDGNSNDHYEIFEALRKEGKIKAYGASIDTHEEIKLLLDTTGAEVVHIFYNILHQDSLEAADIITKKNVGAVAKIPLDSGWLTGKYNKNSVFEGVRNRWSKADIATRAKLIDKLKGIVGSEKPLTSIALAFCLANDVIASVIPGNLTEKQLLENVQSNKPLSNDLITSLQKFYYDEVRQYKLPW